MQRAQPWLMFGMACWTFSVGLIGLASTRGFVYVFSLFNLPVLAFWMLVLGSLIIGLGCVLHFVVPTVRWFFGRDRKLYWLFDKKIKKALDLIKRPPGISTGPGASKIQQALSLMDKDVLDWQRAATDLLTDNYGGPFSTEVKEFSFKADQGRTAFIVHNAEAVLHEQVRFLRGLRDALLPEWKRPH